MNEETLHGEQLTEFDDRTIHELNLHAAKDIVKRAAHGPIIVFVALLVSAFSADMINEVRTLTVVFLVLILISSAWRMSLARLLSQQTEQLSQWKRNVTWSLLSAPVIWGS